MPPPEAKRKLSTAAKGGEDKAPAGEEKPAGDENPFEGWPQAAIDRYKSQEEQNRQLQHSLESNVGRVSALQRKVNTLTGEIDQIRSTTAEKPSDKEISAAMADGDKWDGFKEEYPEIAEAIESKFTKELKSLGDRVDTVSNTIKPVVDRQAENEFTEQRDKVSKEYPLWQQTVYSSEDGKFSDDYLAWYNQQAPGIRSLADSDDVADATSLLGLYDQNRVARGLPSMKADHSDEDVVDKTADQLAAKRQRQLQDGVTLDSRSAGIKPDTSGGDEFENAFNAFAARKEAERQRA